MNCMKCGRETTGTNVFCEKCLAAIDRYPVKPGAPVHLPKRVDDPYRYVRRRRPPTPEEIIATLRSKLRRRRNAIWILLLICLLLIGALVLTFLYPPTGALQDYLTPST